MQTRTDEIADGIYRISTFVPDVAPPAGFTFNQFLIDAEEPLLFHAGHRQMFPLVAGAVATVMPLDRIRWISFGHVEADECGAMNLWLDASPRAEVCHSEMGCLLSLNDLAERPPRPMTDGEILDLGGKRVRHAYTPHVPHNWETHVLFEETTGTLLCGDLFTHVGGGQALTESDIVGPAVQTEDVFRGSSLSAVSGATVRRLARLNPTTLALMHGSSFAGDCVTALHDLAEDYDRRVREVLEDGRAELAGAGCPAP
ncbi:MAG TPA: MBL fold metallo-hydrolase [Acidimicrobiales bacterium]|nr:MBL fold metallo-hydrolase [Acidimicrobiales bacterium]